MGLAAARLLSQLGADVYAICRRNGRHNTLDFPVKKILYADFGSKEDLDLLAEALPDNIYAMFLCHGIALKNDGSNTLEVQRESIFWVTNICWKRVCIKYVIEVR